MFAWKRIRRNIIAYVLVVIVLYAVMPVIMNALHNTYTNPDECAQICVVILQIILPIVAIALPMVFSCEMMSSPGNELLYVGSRIKVYYYLLAYAIYMIAVLPLYILAREKCYVYNYRWEYVRMAIICLFLYGVYYMINYKTGNYLLANIVMIGYNAMSSFGGDGSDWWKILDSELADRALIVDQYGLFLVVGIVSMLLGIYYNDHYEKYM